MARVRGDILIERAPETVFAGAVTGGPDRSSPRQEGTVGGIRRWAYRGGRLRRSVRAVNRAQGLLHSVGVWPGRLATLEVRGRRTGRLIALPVVIADYRAERYLVAMLGDRAGWVRNVEAAAGRAVLRHGRREEVRLEPVPVEDRPPILRRYLECAPGARAHIPVDFRAPLEHFESVASRTPVFRIDTLRSRSPKAMRPGVAESVAGAAAVGAALATSPVLRRIYNRWGATPDEVAADMAGDELVPFARMTSTRAITIAAPPEEVWRWLVQIGQGRGGFYSYDRLPNLIGCRIHSTDRIEADLQQIAIGDQIRLAPGRAPSYRVARIDPPRGLALVGADPDTGRPGPTPSRPDEPGFTWQWSLRPLHDGTHTRLVARQRYSFPRRQSLLWHVVEPIDFVMEHRMLLGLQTRAEGWRDVIPVDPSRRADGAQSRAAGAVERGVSIQSD